MLEPFKHNTFIGDLPMNRLSTQDRAKIIGCLIEGNSVRATARLLDVDKKTILRLLAEVGTACKDFHDKHVRNVSAKRVQCDEIWSFIGMKEKNVPEKCKNERGLGDCYTWTGLDADSKLMISYNVGLRDVPDAMRFMDDLRGRLANRVQLTTDGHRAYLVAVDEAFGGDVDYAMLIKLYSASGKPKSEERKYSPADCCGIRMKRISGNPSKKDISTSYVERMNLNIRMGNRRFTRLTNAFSKKVENHIHALAIYFMHYNFGRIHQTLRVTPAMQAGLTDHVWSLEEIAALAEKRETAVA
jgi:IS1 family transposase